MLGGDRAQSRAANPGVRSGARRFFAETLQAPWAGADKFTKLDERTIARLDAAAGEQLDRYIERILLAQTLADVFAEPD